MAENAFEIVFQKLREAGTDEDLGVPGDPSGSFARELDEIEELRRIVLEVLEEPPVRYTTT